MKLTAVNVTKIMLLVLLLSTLFLAACSGSAAPTADAAPQTDSKEAVFVSECPNGLVNDTYPGSCGQYFDSNSDGICDLSQ